MFAPPNKCRNIQIFGVKFVFRLPAPNLIEKIPNMFFLILGSILNTNIHVAQN